MVDMEIEDSVFEKAIFSSTVPIGSSLSGWILKDGEFRGFDKSLPFFLRNHSFVAGEILKCLGITEFKGVSPDFILMKNFSVVQMSEAHKNYTIKYHKITDDQIKQLKKYFRAMDDNSLVRIYDRGDQTVKKYLQNLFCRIRIL